MTRRCVGFTVLEVLLYSALLLFTIPIVMRLYAVMAHTMCTLRQAREVVMYHRPLYLQLLSEVARAHHWTCSDDCVTLSGIDYDAQWRPHKWRTIYRLKPKGVYRQARQTRWLAPPIDLLQVSSYQKSHLVITYAVNRTIAWSDCVPSIGRMT